MAVISTLPDIYNDVIYLHYLQGFAPKEIAEMLKITAENVWKRIERVKKQLKKKLKEDERNAKV